jgi:hypothetical protein
MEPGRLANMTGRQELTILVVPHLGARPEPRQIQGEMLPTWRESLANVDPRFRAIVRWKEYVSRKELLED